MDGVLADLLAGNVKPGTAMSLSSCFRRLWYFRPLWYRSKECLLLPLRTRSGLLFASSFVLPLERQASLSETTDIGLILITA